MPSETAKASLGYVTSYGAARRGGYTGTYEEWCALMAEVADHLEENIQLNEDSQAAKAAAETAELEAEAAALTAESWAKGTKGGTDVPSTDPAYHDNAKYYSEVAGDQKDQAEQAASAAAGSAETAEGHSTDAEAWAAGTRGGEDVESGDDAYQNNAKYYSEQSSGFADDAAGSASDAEAWAKGTKNGTDVPSTDPTYHNNAKYWSEQAEETAEDIEASSAQIAQNASDIDDLKESFNAFAIDGNYIPIKYSDFASGTVLNGVFNPNIQYRVSTPELVNIPYETTFYVKSGFIAYLYFYDGTTYTGQTVTDSYTIPANSNIKIVIRRTEENTEEVADVAYFVSQINTSNKIKELSDELEITNRSLYIAENNITNIQGRFSSRCGTENIDACNSAISSDRFVRFALPSVANGGSYLDKIVYKSNSAKNIDFYLGLYDSTNENVTIREVITCPVIDGLNILTNGTDFDSETPIENNFVIGYRCENTTELSNGFFGGNESSLATSTRYSAIPVMGDVITVGARTYGIGLYATFKINSISELNNKIEEYNKHKIPWEYAIDNVLCIGDSLTRGSPADSQTMPYPLKENYPYFLERMISVECTNAGVPGISTQNWYKNEYTKYTISDFNTFIIFLGTNGGLSDTLATDVDPYNDYNNFADTQTGNYCKIIEHILEDKNDDAIIILVNTWYNGSGQDTTRLVINKIGEKYSLPVINTISTMPYSVNPAYHGNVDNVHCSKAGYLALASLICNDLRKYIEENPDFANKSMTQG